MSHRMTARDFSAASKRARNGIALVAATFLLVSWALSAWQIYKDYDSRLQQHMTDISALANTMRAQTAERWRIYNQALFGLAQTLEVDRLNDAAYAPEVHRLLQNRQRATIDTLMFFITNEDGVITHTSYTDKPGPIDLKDRPNFEPLGSSAPDTTLTIPAFIGSVGPATGKAILAMVRRLQRSDGSFAGGIYVNMQLNDFAAVPLTLHLGEDSSFGIARLDGTIILRIPAPPGRTFGGRMNTASVSNTMGNVLNPATNRYEPSPMTYDELLANDAVTVLETQAQSGSPFNPPGTKRYMAMRHVENTDLYIYVSTTKTNVLAPWRRNALLTVLQQLLLTLAVVVAVVWTARDLNRAAQSDERHINTLGRLTKISTEFMALRDERALVTQAGDTIRTLIPAHLSSIHFIPPNQSRSDNAHAFSLSEKYARWRGYKAPVDGTGIYGVVIRSNQSMRLNQSQLEAHPHWRHFGSERERHLPLRGWMAAPLIARDGRNIGFVQLSDREHGDFTAGDEAVLMQFAQMLSICLENLRLVNESQASAGQAQAAAAQAQAAAADARATRDQITKVFSATSDAVAVLDRDLRYTFANDPFCDMAGSPREDIVGATIYERLPQARNVHEKLEQCHKTRKRVFFEIGFTNHQDEQRWIEVQAFPMDDSVVASIRDVTERRAADQKLMVAQRMDAVGRLSGGLAHDFNNLLAVVMGNAEILAATLKDQSQTRMANLIRTAAARGGNIVSRLLAFARSRPLDPKPTEVLETAKGVEGLLARSIPTNISFIIEPTSDLWPASVDAAQLENVLVNLVLNARDAMPDGGLVKVKAENVTVDAITAEELDLAAGEYVRLDVTDTGTGMSPDVVARAFEPFFTTKDVGKGSGLGLSMVYGFAQQSGGAVLIDSEVGTGTTISLYLPRATSKLITGYTATALPYDPTGSERILLVEDDDMVRDFVEVMLRGLGYQVIAHGNAEAALAAVKAGFQPQLLLSDMMLRGTVSGEQLAKQIVQLSPFTRVLFMSGYAENTTSQSAKVQSAKPGLVTEVLRKPFRRNDLAVKIRTALTAQPTVIDQKAATQDDSAPGGAQGTGALNQSTGKP
ncbi:MAG: PAS domain-containing protein [Rhodospirillaceae bacterium]|nr:PAS domain-containing protein [Rhodospirillaceae bacterium]